jgi:DNA-binding response OmpR family regulator
MSIRASYVPFRYPRYPGRASTLSRGHAPIGQEIGVPFQTGRLPLGGRHILIIEEKAINARPLMFLLQQWGHEVAISNLQSLTSREKSARTPDVVILSASWLDIDFEVTAKQFSGRRIRLILIGGSQEAAGRLRRDHADVHLLSADWQPTQLSAILQGAESHGQLTSSEPTLVIKFGRWIMDVDERILQDELGEIILLSDCEFRLLRTFVMHPRRVLSRHQLLDLLTFAGSDISDRSIDAQICRLRRRLAAGHDLIRTVRNEGYIFSMQVSRLPRHAHASGSSKA